VFTLICAYLEQKTDLSTLSFLSSSQVFFNSMHDLLTEKASTVIFANIETVLIAAVTLLSDLEERQKASRLYVNTVGDLLERHMPSMNVYMPYCVNQSSAAQILEAERKRDPNIQNHLQMLRSSHPAARNLDLSSFLLIPSWFLKNSHFILDFP